MSLCAIARALALPVLAIAALQGADDGFAWRRVEGVRDAVRPYPSSIDPEIVYVWTGAGLVATHDGGVTFAPLPAAPALGEITALLVTPNRPQRLLAGTAEHGVFASDDGGATWRALGGVDQGLAHLRIRCLAFAPDDSAFATIYATHSLAEKGISVTIDGGRHWRAFATDYGADDLVPRGSAVFFAGRSASQGDGFFRHDPSRGWLCVLTEPPRALIASQVAPQRVWFGTQGSGLRVSDDFGVSMRDGEPGPHEADVVSLAIGWASATEETVYAFDPAGEGVMRSRDGFATWERLGDGFPPSEWTREGACLAADAAGRALYACRNGELYRGAPARHGPLLAAPRAEPAAAVAEVDAIRLSCQAEPGTAITIDCTALGGPAALALADAGGGLYAATLAQAKPPRSGQFALPVTAAHGAEQAHDLAVVTVLPHIVDALLWNGEDHDNGVNWNSGSVSVGKVSEHALSPPAHLRLNVGGAGRAGFGWNGWGGGVDASRHKLLGFSIRSDQAGPPKLRIAVRDDGSGAGLQASQNSNEVELARYLPQVGTEYRFVAIPIADLVFGSPASPNGLREIVFISDGGENRAYGIDDIALLARPAPRLGGAEARLQDDDRDALLAVPADSDSSPLRAVTARIGEAEFPLFDDGQHGDGAAGDARWAALVPVERAGRGTRAISFRARDDEGEAQLAYEGFIPGRAPTLVPRRDEPFAAGDAAPDQSEVPALLAEGGALKLDARLQQAERMLFLSVTVIDPTPAAKPPEHPTVAQLRAGPCVELLLTSPGERKRRRGGDAATVRSALLAPGASGGWAAAGSKVWACGGAKTETGWRVHAQIPLDALDPNWVVTIGGSARLQLIVRDAAGHAASWSGGEGAVSDPEHFGEALFSDAAGAPRWRCVSAVGPTLTLAANKALDPASAAVATHWQAAGMTVIATALEADRRTVRLTADKAWPVGSEIRLTFPGLRAEDGAAATGELACSPQPGRPVDDGYIKEFLIGEVRPNIDWTKVDQPLMDESAHPSRASGWKFVTVEGGVDLGTLIGGNNVGAHAHVYLWSESERTVQLWMGSDDGLRVAVNGQCVHQFSGARGVVPDQDKVPNVKLKQGWNDLLLLVTQGGGGWGFCLRVRDDQGKAPSGLCYAADSPFAP